MLPILAAILVANLPIGAADDRWAGLEIVTLPIAEGADLRFNHLVLGESPNHSRVNQIVQDDLGFLWLATDDGLKRYDGYRIRDFHHDPNNPNSPTDNYILTLFKDRSGRLWIANGRYLQTYDPNTETFTLFRPDPRDPAALKARIGEINQDRAGTIWLSTDAGLYRTDPATGMTAHYQHNPKDDATLSSNIVRSTVDTRDGTLWVATATGLDTLDRRTGKVARRVPFPMAHSIGTQLFEDHAGTVWLTYGGTHGPGLAAIDPNTNQLKHYVLFPSEEKTSPGVKTVFEDADGNLWLGTAHAGLYKMDRERKHLVRYRNAPTDPASLGSDQIASLFQDREGGVWIGMMGDGADRFTRKPLAFRRIVYEPGNPDSIDKDVINAAFEDSHGDLWLGENSRLVKLDRRTGKLESYHSLHHLPGEISANMVVSIVEDRAGFLWFGTNGGGLSRLDRRSGKFKAFLHDKNNPRSLSEDSGRSLLIDHNGTLWAGTADGLNAFDPQTEDFRVYAPPVKPTNYRSIAEDSKGQLWLSSGWSGLHRFDPATGRFTVYRHSDNPGSLNNDSVNAVSVDHSGMVWLGTQDGLSRLDPATGVFTAYQLGPPDGPVNGILEDARGNLWLSTNSGLLRFDPRQNAVRRYSTSDGLAANEFALNAVWKSPRGEMFFGSYGGLTFFDPEQIVDSAYVPPVRLTEVQILGKPVSIGGHSPLKRSITVTDSMTLHHAQSVVSFEFSALSYANPDRNRYRYRLEGLETEWREVDSSRRSAMYTTLPTGSYTFRVVGSSNRGIWNDQGVSLRITVLPPWWANWWFRSGVALAVLFLLWTLHQRRLRRLTQEFQVRVEERVNERTRIARELHDTLLQSFQGFMLRLQIVDELLPPGRAKEQLGLTLDIAERAVVEGRDAVQDLRSNAGENGLAAAVRAIGEEMAGDDSAGFRLVVDGAPQELQPIVRDELYRIAREALRNAFTHARARHIEAEITFDRNFLRLRIRDDGQGIPQEVVENGRPGHYGLRGMKERAHQIAARMTVFSGPGTGTEIEISVPNSTAYVKKASSTLFFRTGKVTS